MEARSKPIETITQRWDGTEKQVSSPPSIFMLTTDRSARINESEYTTPPDPSTQLENTELYWLYFFIVLMVLIRKKASTGHRSSLKGFDATRDTVATNISNLQSPISNDTVARKSKSALDFLHFPRFDPIISQTKKAINKLTCLSNNQENHPNGAIFVTSTMHW